MDKAIFVNVPIDFRTELANFGPRTEKGDVAMVIIAYYGSNPCFIPQFITVVSWKFFLHAVGKFDLSCQMGGQLVTLGPWLRDQ